MDQEKPRILEGFLLLSLPQLLLWLLLMVLLSSPYVRSEYDAPHRLVRYTRTALGFSEMIALEAAYGDLIRSTLHLHLADLGLLVDVRAAPPRNDPAFEEVMAHYRIRMMRGFARVAILVQSAVGKLQVRRHSHDDGIVSLVTQEEKEALTYLSNLPPHQSGRPIKII